LGLSEKSLSIRTLRLCRDLKWSLARGADDALLAPVAVLSQIPDIGLRKLWRHDMMNVRLFFIMVKGGELDSKGEMDSKSSKASLTLEQLWFD
jgi:hypothetical protein